ncbi:MAG: HupE/UreJ family protein [Flavobacteriaceae bacterium]|nr:HupE/UreJ family protein [Bacteroidia bacterium]NNK88468.1 HupE/UreJ family protein [Flavobacteriaceae bacterium]
MFDEFWFNVEYGLKHVLDINGYDHVLFLMVLSVPYLFRDWKRVLILVSVFTLGHTASLVLATYDVLKIDSLLVEFLIPITIMVVAVYNVFTASEQTKQEKLGVLFLSTLFFGLIHGLGFAGEFKMFVGRAENKLMPLIEFALGIELAQLIIVFVVLFLGFLGHMVFNASRRDWKLVVSAMVIGMVIPMIINSEYLS